MEWISVKDRLPSTDGRYIATDGEYVYIGEFKKQSYFINGALWGVDGESLTEITHWMPLPEPPTSV